MSPLQAELDRVTRDLDWALRYGDGRRESLAAEVPIRIHAAETDDGHGLGGPKFHPGFEAYLADSGVCFCEPKPDREEIMRLRHTCAAKGQRNHRLRRGGHNRTRRLARALRQVRSLDPAAFDIAYLVVARGMRGPDVRSRLDGSRAARGKSRFTDEEWAVALVSALDLTLATY